MESELRKRRSGGENKAKGKTRKGKKLLHVAPLNTPLSNRLETIGIIWHTISIPTFTILFLYTLSLGVLGWLLIVLPYFIWWYGFDLHTPSNGKVVYRVRDWMKNLIIWEWFVDYFPIRVYKSCDLEPTFSTIPVAVESLPDDEEDLVSEHSRTLIDGIFKKLGLSKRLNDIDGYLPPPTGSNNKDPVLYHLKKVTTGPRYIFGYHPHGVISMGVMGLFATNALRNEPFQPIFNFLKPLFHDSSKGKRILPGIGNIFPLTLTTQFTLPYYRDYLLGLGLTSASSKNIKSLINNGDNSVCIVVGGAQESLLNQMVAPRGRVGSGYKHEDTEDETEEETEEETATDSKEDAKKNAKENSKADSREDLASEKNEKSKEEGEKEGNEQGSKREIKLVLNRRKGFIKLAIELGNVSLVPTFAFGEADIYRLNTPKPGSLGNAFQKWMKSTFQFTLPFFSARGVFIYDFGFLPYRNPINIVIGNPIHVPEGVLAEYKQTHPEFDDSQPALALAGKNRNGSFSSLFLLSSLKRTTPNATKKNIPQELIDRYHKLYVDELKRVFEENKHKYGYEDVSMSIIE
ncbi:uncharacterized protein PRCAT00004102001 [Priceomyces carsonii]|uniref:uncharacterized protein n=1 Tax=Priceomyces carsonii TaxID=28549 RepID=UPI002EDAACA7|nr:unnamed protein product [Priceomyces carsonii]